MKIITFSLLVSSLLFFGACAQKTASHKKDAPPSQITKIEYSDDLKSEEALAEQLATTLAAGKTPVLYFHAHWCGPCKAFKATLPDAQVEETMKDVDLIMINVDEAPELAGKYGVRYIPFFVKVDKAGTALKTISSSAWGEPTPTNVAAAMGLFLN